MAGKLSTQAVEMGTKGQKIHKLAEDLEWK